MPTDLEINEAARPLPLSAVAERLGLDPERVVPYGRHKAKVWLDPADQPRGAVVLVSAMTPTAAGEGKTTVSIGLADGLSRLGTRVAVALREPSLGPTLGRKGGATGGGHAQLVPMVDLNLHFTGDLHAVTTAHNVLAALVDDHLHFGNTLGIAPHSITWPRVLDLEDRALRHLVTGLGGRSHGVPRETGFHITAASEVMAILCLARDRADLLARLGRIVVGRRKTGGAAVTARDLGADGVMGMLLSDALHPNLVQTLEGTPAFVHGGPFANIAQGTSSVIATRTAAAHADVVVTEAGFAFDLGGEKFLDLKCPAAGLWPSVVVLVATLRALRAHGGGGTGPESVRRGLANLAHHTALAQGRSLPVVIALNQFADDTPAEQALVERFAAEVGAGFAVCRAHAEGGAGAEDLAAAVRDRLGPERSVTGFQVPGDPTLANLERVATTVYGATGVELSAEAEHDLGVLGQLGLDRLPVCVAKTAASLTDDPTLLGGPHDRPLHVQSLQASAGAGFVVAVAGDIQRMPGMPKVPGALGMGVTAQGRVVGVG
jgi:formate--tetrahydrofolate ligase